MTGSMTKEATPPLPDGLVEQRAALNRAICTEQEVAWALEYGRDIPDSALDRILTALTPPAPVAEEGLVERIASAIHDARYDGAIHEPHYVPFEREDGSGRDYCLRLARAAIAAGTVQQEGAYRAMDQFVFAWFNKRLPDQMKACLDAYDASRQALAQSDLTPGSGEG